MTKIPTGYQYVFEEQIALAGSPEHNMKPMIPGESYGFDAEFCDADDGVQLEGFIWWSSDGTKDAWNFENLWGTMNLAASVGLPDTDVVDVLPISWGWMKR